MITDHVILSVTIIVGLLIVAGSIILDGILVFKLFCKKEEYEFASVSVNAKKETLMNLATLILTRAINRKTFLEYVARRATRIGNHQEEAEKDLIFLRDILNFVWEQTECKDQDLAEFFRTVLYEKSSDRFQLKR